MKYFKLTQVDTVTGISCNVKNPENGLDFPILSGLEVKFQDANITEFWYGTANDDAIEDPENQCWEITLIEFAEALKQTIIKKKQIISLDLDSSDRRTREIFLRKFDTTALIASIYKYEQAKSVILGLEEPTPELSLEAATRGINIVDLAHSVIEKKNSYIKIDALIAGLRGKLQDRLDLFEVDVNDPLASLEEWESEEDIGQGIMLPKYNSDICGRLVQLLQE